MTRIAEAANEQIQGLREQMQRLSRSGGASKGKSGAGFGTLAGLNYAALLTEVLPMVTPFTDCLLARFRKPEVVVVDSPAATVVRRPSMFGLKRMAVLGTVLAVAGLAYGFSSGKLRVGIPARRA